jgi:hypothetical protein
MSEHPDPNQKQLQRVDSTLLTPLVRKSLDDARLVVSNWHYDSVRGGAGGGLGGTFIYRFSGGADLQHTTVSWSLILKIVHARPSEEPTSTHYWKREAELYRSDLVVDLPGHLRAAKCFAVEEYPDEACWIWQEDVQDAVGQTWDMEHYGLTARHLGQFNGAYLRNRPIPAASWLATGWLRKIAQATEPVIPKILELLNYAPMKQALPQDAERQFMRFWDERERFLDGLDKLPQTFCHQDPVRRNLFIRRTSDGDYETIAIDWAFVGRAAVGMDIAVPLIINLAFWEVDIAQARALASSLYEGYLNGLADAGWTGDPDIIRLGFAASVAGKFIELLMLTATLGLADTAQHESWVEFSGVPIEQNIQLIADIISFVFPFIDEARTLMDRLDF